MWRKCRVFPVSAADNNLSRKERNSSSRQLGPSGSGRRDLRGGRGALRGGGLALRRGRAHAGMLRPPRASSGPGPPRAAGGPAAEVGVPLLRAGDTPPWSPAAWLTEVTRQNRPESVRGDVLEASELAAMRLGKSVGLRVFSNA